MMVFCVLGINSWQDHLEGEGRSPEQIFRFSAMFLILHILSFANPTNLCARKPPKHNTIGMLSHANPQNQAPRPEFRQFLHSACIGFLDLGVWYLGVYMGVPLFWETTK